MATELRQAGTIKQPVIDDDDLIRNFTDVDTRASQNHTRRRIGRSLVTLPSNRWQPLAMHPFSITESMYRREFDRSLEAAAEAVLMDIVTSERHVPQKFRERVQSDLERNLLWDFTPRDVYRPAYDVIVSRLKKIASDAADQLTLQAPVVMTP